MASKGSPLGRDGGNDLLDRSKVRILLCDNDVKSSQEVLRLLYKCSYQVTSVRTARQVIDALNAEGPKIDIILTEVDLPIAKGLKMLKYIMRDTELRQIPIIMMSSQDEVSVVVKCLRLGAADYLVKPLRTNELLNLWTHMWRRRRMLGLTEKNILSHDFDLVASDPSDANTNSTTLFSDETDEKSQRSTLPETSMSNPRDNKSNAPSAVEPSPENLSELQPSASEPCDFVGGILSRPKKSKLKVGESSAFFTYVKSSMPTSGSPRFASADENVALPTSGSPRFASADENVALPTSGSPRFASADENLAFSKRLINELELPVSCKPVGNVEKQDETWESCSHGSHDNVLEVGASGRSSSVSIPLEYQGWNLSREQLFSLQVHSNTEGHAEVSGIPSLSPLPFCLPGMPNQIMMPPSVHLFQGNLHDVPKHATSATLPQYNTLPPCPHIPMITPLHYYPVRVGMQLGQMPAPHMWPSSPEVKSGRVERREAALIKFRQKRKDRCFEKKIRYVNRKRLAEKRPRVRGQFVRQMNDFNVDLNGHPIAVDDSDEDEQEEEDDEEDV